MVFMVFQLNTLNLLDDKGVWNRCWYSPLMPMFERLEKDPNTYYIYEDAETGDELSRFDRNFAKTFINFVNNKTK